MIDLEQRQRIEQIVGQPLRHVAPLQGGMIAEVLRLTFGNRELVAKVDRGQNPKLDVEGKMLGYLAQYSALPVPQVIHSSADLLLMTFEAGVSRFDVPTERHAADLLAGLHHVSAENYGFPHDTLIGKFVQPNPQTASWIDFFRQHRIWHMAQRAHQMSLLPATTLTRIERLLSHIDQWLTEPDAPALIHGDVWATNLLASEGQVTAFLDPAIYYADAEIELSYILWTNTFGDAFFDRYADHRALSANFFTERQHIYALYPILVHVLHFGRTYLQPLDATLKRFGY